MFGLECGKSDLTRRNTDPHFQYKTRSGLNSRGGRGSSVVQEERVEKNKAHFAVELAIEQHNIILHFKINWALII